MAQFIRAFFWTLAALAAVIAGFDLFTTVNIANGAPQQAAGAAMAAATAVVPYVFARAVDSITRSSQPATGSRGYTPETRPCPSCAEPIRRGASVCRFCGQEVEPLISESDVRAAKAGIAANRRPFQ